MKQKAKDILLLLQKSRKAQVVCVALALSVLFLYMNEPKKRRPRAKKVEQGTGALSDERYNDLITAFKEGLDDLKVSSTENRQALTHLRQDMEDYELRTAEIFKKILERIAAAELANQDQGDYPEPRDFDDGLSDQVEALERFGDIPEAQVGPPPKQGPNKLAVIGAGDSVRVKLLAGVNAPTDGTPYPVIFKLVGDVQGPDGSSLPLGEARVIAAAQGSLVDQRVLFRITKLSMRFPNGRRKVISCDGWIVGEDGLRGMQGLLIDPMGRVITAQTMAGTIGGLGTGIAKSQETTLESNEGNIYNSVDGDTLNYALGIGLQEGAREWSKFVEKRADKLVPAVQVFSGREATVVFAESVAIKDLFEELAGEEADVFASLD